MPVCEGCGSSYENQFKFCPHCGRAKPEPATLKINVTSDDVWETCEIYIVSDKKSIFKTEWLFEATAIGTKGRYSADRSEALKLCKPVIFLNTPIYSGDYYVDESRQNIVLVQERCQPKLDKLIQKLVANDWQSTGRGQEWFSERFRRKVKK